MFLKPRASEVLTKHTFAEIPNSSQVGLISVCIFTLWDFFFTSYEAES